MNRPRSFGARCHRVAQANVTEALSVYVAASLESRFAGILYVLVFGLGAILGMVALTAAIAMPLRATAIRLTWANCGLQCVIGLVSVTLGVRLVMAQGEALWA